MYEERSLPSAAAAPRIDGGVLKWYAGDTFDLQVQLELKDEHGEEIEIAAEHKLVFLFRDLRRRLLYELMFTDITDNTVVVRFTEPVTALIPKGRYTYDVIYYGTSRRTLAHDAPIWVE